MEITPDEAASIGQEIYAGIREEMEAKHWGELVVIDVRTGDYEVGEYKGERSDMELTKRLQERRPNAFTWAELVSSEKPYSPVRLGWRGTMEILAARKSKIHD